MAASAGCLISVISAEAAVNGQLSVCRKVGTRYQPSPGLDLGRICVMHRRPLTIEGDSDLCL